MSKAFFVASILILGQSLYAQNISNKGRFSVDYISGCAPLTVTLTDLGTVVNTGNAPILVHFNRNPADPESIAGIINPMITGGSIDTTYTMPGTYLIGQINGSLSGSDSFDFIEVVVTESVQPVFSVDNCTNNTVVIDVDFSTPGDTYDSYFIDFGDGQSTTVRKTDPPMLTHVYAAQNVYTVSVTGQLDSGFTGSCGSADQVITTITDLPLPQITELNILSATSISLTYSALETNIGYELEIDDGNGFQPISLLSPIDNSTSFTLDNANLDFENNTYVIRISATEACGSSSGVSNSVPTISLTYNALYVGNTIDILFDWNTTDIDLIELFLLLNGNILDTTMDVNGNWLVVWANCSEALTYQVEGNFMGAVSRSLAVSPELFGTLTPPAVPTPEISFSGGSLLVRWSAPDITSSEYRIYRQNSNGNYEQIGTSTAIQFLDNTLTANTRQVCYRVSYLDECGNESELSPEICENLSNQILLPNAFTPNGDGLNDVFRVLEGVYRNFQFNIYNRWGALVFATNNSANGWDGTLNGQMAPPGAYIYRIEYFDTSDRLMSVTGTFLLIR